MATVHEDRGSGTATPAAMEGGPTVSSITSPDQELCRSFKTVTEMLRDRGQPSEVLESMSAEDVLQAAMNRPYVFYIDDPKIGYRIIYDIVNPTFKLQTHKKMLESMPPEIKSVIIVIRKRVANTTTEASTEKFFRDIGIEEQFFELKRLQFNLTRHFLVPKHEPIRDEETIGRILAQYMLKSRFQLPIIYDKDPMAQYLALKHGQLVKITRNSPTAGVHVVYRCCCTKAEK